MPTKGHDVFMLRRRMDRTDADNDRRVGRIEADQAWLLEKINKLLARVEELEKTAPAKLPWQA